MIGSRLPRASCCASTPHQFRLLMDGLLAGAGLVLLWGAFVLPH